VSDRVASETELIDVYLAPLAAGSPGAFGLKDDAALIETKPGFDLVVSTDPVIAGVHFFGDDAPGDVAWKALAVNVSDLAAKGAEPIAYTMALAFPEAPRRDWMAAFCAGLLEAQTSFGCKLIGGDTDRTPGPLSIGITAFGKVPHGQMLKRNSAQIGDHVFVTGTIGDAALGLMLRRSTAPAWGAEIGEEHRKYLLGRYLRPLPRLALGATLRHCASAALDVSDGLLKDAGRLAAGASVALEINAQTIPLSLAATAAIERQPEFLEALVTGGDDYEILCAVNPLRCDVFRQQAAAARVPITEIGVLTRGSGVTLVSPNGKQLTPVRLGYDHFRTKD
jgi:thiamine-monophosphate kinase